jgi:hypothetical protein
MSVTEEGKAAGAAAAAAAAAVLNLQREEYQDGGWGLVCGLGRGYAGPRWGRCACGGRWPALFLVFFFFFLLLKNRTRQN